MYVAFGVVLVVAGFCWADRPRLVPVNAAVADDFPSDTFSHATFERLLGAYVDANGHVDYERWYDDAVSVADLESYLAAVAAYSPESTPERFASRNDELAYWLYAYNAYVIRSVLAHWPLDSVTDVKAPIEVVEGMGFFYQLRYMFGGRVYRLLAIDHDSQTVYLSAIFKWYEDDYLNWLRANGRTATNGLPDYIMPIAVGGLARDFERAGSYAIEFRDFDWTVNASSAATVPP